MILFSHAFLMHSTCKIFTACLVAPQVMGNNSVVPAHHEVSLHAVEDNQPVACVDIYEGCGSLATCLVLLLPL